MTKIASLLFDCLTSKLGSAVSRISALTHVFHMTSSSSNVVNSVFDFGQAISIAKAKVSQSSPILGTQLLSAPNRECSFLIINYNFD